MNLSTKATTAVIVIALFSLVGLCWMQYNWLNESILTHRKTFYQKVDLASELIGKWYREDKNLLREIVSDIGSSGALANKTDSTVRSVIDTVLSIYNIQTSYTYGIYDHNTNGDPGFRFVAGTSTDSAVLLIQCNPEDRSYGWTGLTCGISPLETTSYHFGIFFPDVNDYVFSTVKGSLITSVLFIGLIIGCFAYTVLTIRRQKKLSQLKNDFINNLTHEFKTPIFSIDLASGMLKKADEITGSERLSRYLEVIDTEGKRLKSQVDKVLQMALVDSGNFKLEKKAVDLHELLIAVSRNFTLLIRDRKGHLRLNLDAKRSVLYADETHLKNIIYNLLDNAQKYTEKAPDIEVTTSDLSEGLMVSIRDNGIGMSEEVQKFIFDKFYRASSGNVHNVKGFGLGLSYVKSIVEAHKGKIELKKQSKGR